MTDEQAMQRAIELALHGTGHVSPNPRVGCLILRYGEIIAEGWHHAYGGPHAEVDALAHAIQDVEGAALYVNLEPCSHYGKTPPCADLLIERKISRVVVGMTDPNPQVAGRGIEKLRQAGMTVEVGVLEAECRWVNRFFSRHVTTGLPYVIAKSAQSMDGCIATQGGESQWISSEESRRRVHELRAEVDAILVGRNTVLQDNPRLTVRHAEGRNPRRFVCDTKLSLPLDRAIFTEPLESETWVVCNEEASLSPRADVFRERGIRVLPIPADISGQLDLRELLVRLGAMNVTSLLVEGGAGMYSSFASADLIDELHLYVAPLLIGDGRHAFAALSTPLLSEARHFRFEQMEMSGPDIHAIAVRTER